MAAKELQRTKGKRKYVILMEKEEKKGGSEKGYRKLN